MSAERLTSNSAPLSAGAIETSREPAWLILAVAGALFLARLLSANYGAFYEGDETSIAAGVAGLARDNVAHLYRYGPQAGYYRLVQGINALLGNGVSTIPFVMVSLSVVAGSLIPIMGLYAFRADLTRTERWLLAATLAANPILWTSSQYGNTAIASTALVVAAVLLLSNVPKRGGEILALVLFACAILVRADAVLATGAVAVMLWRNRGSFRAAALRVAIVGIVLAAIYAALFAFDPYMGRIWGEVRSHLTTPDRTRFFELLLWAVSPLPLAFAILGLRELEPKRRWLLAIIAAWCVPSMGFYFASTTTPRYFVLPAFAIAIATAVGMNSVARLVPRWSTLAWAIVLLAGSLHLFVGLSNFYPNVRRSWLTDARTGSHDGDVLAGAFLYDSYIMHPWRQFRFLHPRIETRKPAYRAYATAFRELRSGSHRGEQILLIFAGGDGHAVHFFAEQAGATVADKQRRYRPSDAVVYDIAGARLTAVGMSHFEGDSAAVVPAKAGDRIWLLNRHPGDAPDTEDSVNAHLAPGLRLGKAGRVGDAPMLWAYQVASVTP